MNRDERQKLGIRRWIDSGGRGVLEWATGTGKTNGSIMVIKSLYKHNDLYKKAKDYMKLRQINALVNKLNRCTDSDSKKIKKILDAVELLYELNGCEWYGSRKWLSKDYY